jgi:hypothetical protein
MEKRIKIKAGNVEVQALLNDSPSAQKIWDSLPIEGEGDTWGDEIYFGIPVKASLEKSAREVVEIGDLGFWPPGQAFCIFFGPTPASQGNEVRPASAVNLVGRLLGDPKIFKNVSSGAKVKLEKE